jgi:hypothetical protein
MQNAALISSFRGRLQLAEAEQQKAASENPLHNDSWYPTVARLKGRADFDGYEYLESRRILDLLQVPVSAKRSAMYRRLTALTAECGWEAIRIKTCGVDGGGVVDRVRGYRRKTNKPPFPNVPKEFPGRIDTSTRYILEKVCTRLQADSRWALSRSVEALVAERDDLKEKLAALSADRNAYLDRSAS